MKKILLFLCFIVINTIAFSQTYEIIKTKIQNNNSTLIIIPKGLKVYSKNIYLPLICDPIGVEQHNQLYHIYKPMTHLGSKNKRGKITYRGFDNILKKD